MSTQKKTVLEPLRLRLRRIQFTVGLGFLALVAGTVLTSAVSLRLAGRVGALPSWAIEFLLAPVLRHLWVLAALPVLCYGAARIIELSPWSTAIGAAATGLCFTLAIEFTSNGVDGWMASGGLSLLAELAVVAGGVVITRRAVVRGRADAGKQQTQAQEKASARQDEYAEFLRDAELRGREDRPARGREGRGAGGSRAVAAVAGAARGAGRAHRGGRRAEAPGRTEGPRGLRGRGYPGSRAQVPSSHRFSRIGWRT
ncbi:hypothetical protein ACN28I_14545 [Archangium gephyra]|uniref:hypothetical protein n=1 Tax=Archangium gephyra TaxID=48 RepID=UPI003B7FE518